MPCFGRLITGVMTTLADAFDMEVETPQKSNEVSDEEAVAEVSKKRKRAPPKKSRYPGVKWVGKMKKWEAKMTVDREVISYGLFDTEELAGRKYREMFLRLRPDATRLEWKGFEDEEDGEVPTYEGCRILSMVDCAGNPPGYLSASNRPVLDEVSSNSETLGSKDTIEPDPFDLEEEGGEVTAALEDVELELQWKAYYDAQKDLEN